MTTYNSLGLPVFETGDKIAASGDGLREDLNLITATAANAISQESAQAEESATATAMTYTDGLINARTQPEKTAMVPLTLPDSGSTETQATRHVRIPVKVGARVPRFRVHFRNYNDRTDTHYGNTLTFSGVWIGKRAKDVNGEYTADFTEAPTMLSAPSRTDLGADGYRWTTAIVEYPLETGVEYLLSYGYTAPGGQVQHLGYGGCYLGDTPAVADYVTVSGMVQSDKAPLDVYIAAYVPGDTPIYAYVGSSTVVGVGTDWPVRDSYATKHAYASNALPMLIAASGAGMTTYTSTSKYVWKKARAFASPDFIHMNLHSNDVYTDGISLETLQTRNTNLVKTLRSQLNDRVAFDNVAARAGESTAAKDLRLAYNQWLAELPNRALATYDLASATVGPDGSMAPVYNSGDGIHLNTQGQAKTAEAVIRAGGAQGVPGAAGAGVPAGGSALQLLRKSATGTTTEWVTPAKSLVGLSNVDNTADVDKPVSAAQSAALDEVVILAGEPSGTDDTAALNAKLAASTGKTLRLRAARTYKISDTLTLPTGTTLDLNGATIDATSIPDGALTRQRFGILSTGSIGSSILAGAPISKWSRTITALASTTGLAAGDLIRIRNFENPGPGGTKTVIDKGELNVIASVDSSTQITLAYGMLFDYANDGSLVVAKLNPVKDITIRNGTLLMGGVGSAHTGIAFQYARNVNVVDVEVIGGEDTGVLFAHTWRGNVRGGHIADSTSPVDVAVGIAGYGVCLEDASRFIQVSGVQFDNCRSFVNGGGFFPASNVDVMWNQGRKASIIGYGAHEPCFYWKFSNNTVIGGGGGIQFRGQHGIVESNTVLDCAGNGIRFYADEGITAQDDVIIRGNHVENCGSGIVVDGIVVNSTAVESVKRGVKIDDNRIFKSLFDAILLKNFDTASVMGNLIDGALSNGINITGVSAANPSKNLMMARNQIKNVTLVGIKAKWVNDIDLAVGSIDTTGQQGVLLDTCIGTTTSGGSIRRTSANAIRIVNGSVHVVNIGTIKELVGAATDAVVAVTATDVSILGGIATGVRYGVYTSGCDRVIVSGVNANASGNATKIFIETATTYRLSANIGTSNPAS